MCHRFLNNQNIILENYPLAHFAFYGVYLYNKHFLLYLQAGDGRLGSVDVALCVKVPAADVINSNARHFGGAAVYVYGSALFVHDNAVCVKHRGIGAKGFGGVHYLEPVGKGPCF